MYNSKMMNPGILFLVLVILAVWFFTISALIMVTYNNSIVKMNENLKPLDYTTSMIFVLFLSFLSLILGTYNNCTNMKFKFN
jgi:hypothetical protein